ncbi:MAG: class I SAM-dependent methyltransferase [Burkholderiales bacterium]|nr:class I SAM-dependent methyltransferase [Burkholderiales bacterium]
MNAPASNPLPSDDDRVPTAATGASPPPDGGEGEDYDTAIESFDDWLRTPLGARVMACEQTRFEAALADLFGFYALQMGCAAWPLLAASRITHRFTMGWETQASLIAEPDQLPFTENQFDLVVMPHVLEFQALPHEVLRETFRVLRPEGHLLLSAFNPYSPFGLKRALGRDRSPPWGGEFMALAQVKDWLTLLGFDVRAGYIDAYALPAANERTLRRFAWVERMGERWWPFAGGVYVLHAVKRVAGVRLLRPDWARAPRRRRAASTVPTRGIGRIGPRS